MSSRTAWPVEWLLGMAEWLIPADVLVRLPPRDAQLNRFLRRAQLTTVNDFPDRKAAAIVGRIRLVDAPLIAPLSRRPCAYYEVVFGGPSRRAGFARTEIAGQDFFVDDGTGTALVRIAGAKVAVVKDGHRRSVSFDDRGVYQSDLAGADRLRRAVADVPRLGAAGAASEHGVPVETVRSWIRESLRSDPMVHEGVLQEGEQVAVFGRGSRELDPDPSATSTPYRGRATRLVVRARFVSDDPSARADSVAGEHRNK